MLKFPTEVVHIFLIIFLTTYGSKGEIERSDENR